MFIPHVKTPQNVTVFFDGQPNIVAVGTVQYDLVMAAIDAGDLQGVRDAINARQAVVNKSHGKITLNGTTLMYEGRPLHGGLVNRILAVVKDAGDAGPLLNFLDRLMQNPSKRAVDELYGFIGACDLPITDDGHFLAYKIVRDDYFDIYTGTMDNSVGKVVSMPRNEVDDNKDNTCSEGLHFCSKSYLPHYGSGGSRHMVVKIDPADVVSIPSDYNNAKGRACRYLVVDELAKDKFIIPDYTASYGWDEDDDLDGEDGEDIVMVKTPAPKPHVQVSVAVGQTSLTDQQVRNIRKLIDEGWPLSSIAKVEGTSARTVARIRDNETYTDVV